MSEKKFVKEKNQELWNMFVENKTKAGISKVNIAQSKVALIAYEEMTSNNIEDITENEIIKLDEKRQGKNINHLRAFLIWCVEYTAIDFQINVLTYLIPSEYKKIVEKIKKKF